jgi:serine/threonine-protein kinase
MDAMLIRLGLFDSRRNQAGGGILHRFDSKVDGTMHLVVDSSTGLTWDARGSPRAGTFDDCQTYIDSLNAARAGGSADWRVPTAEELMSLMEPEPINEFHVSPLFRRGGNFFWTADRAQAEGWAWVVYFADGCIESEQLRFNAWVRAVR